MERSIQVGTRHQEAVPCAREEAKENSRSNDLSGRVLQAKEAYSPFYTALSKDLKFLNTWGAVFLMARYALRNTHVQTSGARKPEEDIMMFVFVLKDYEKAPKKKLFKKLIKLFPASVFLKEASIDSLTNNPLHKRFLQEKTFKRCIEKLTAAKKKEEKISSLYQLVQEVHKSLYNNTDR